MKKEEKVEIQYVKRSTMITAALVCLVVGFAAGMIFESIKSKGPKVRKMTVQQEPVSPVQNTNTLSQQLRQVSTWQQQVADNPQDADAWARLGNAYFDMDRYEDAISAYKKHLELKPDNANVWTDMGIMLRRSGRPQEAVNAFDKAVDIDPRHEQSRFNKGVVLLHDLQDPQAALKAWEDLLKINPEARAPNGQSVKVMVEALRAPTK